MMFVIIDRLSAEMASRQAAIIAREGSPTEKEYCRKARGLLYLTSELAREFDDLVQRAKRRDECLVVVRAEKVVLRGTVVLTTVTSESLCTCLTAASVTRTRL